ncbi:MAG: radical SAM protein [Chloroflexi bacterium]|nr:radical SAM protein [Chloroflexota bacterium]
MASYRKDPGLLRERAAKAWDLLSDCRLCPRGCRVNRLAGELGKCRTGERAWVASYGPHFGEEAPLVGHQGSGTIFFAHCNLHCLFCQNYIISQGGEGRLVSHEELAAIMLSLQQRGCHNINLVTPSHVLPQVLRALELAADRGLELPLVWNCGGYESVSALRMLEGIVDIYMPDMKYADAATGERLSGVRSYPAVNRAAVREMHRQVGDLVIDQNGVAVQGLLVRHLVLPQGLAGTEEVVRFLGREVSPHTYLNVMAQYHPCYRAYSQPPLDRPLTRQEHAQAVQWALEAGATRLDGWARPGPRATVSVRV